MNDTHSMTVAVCQRCGNRVVDFGPVTIEEEVIPGQRIKCVQLLCRNCTLLLQSVATGQVLWFGTN